MRNKKLWKLYKTVKKKGIPPEEEKHILKEIKYKGVHEISRLPSLNLEGIISFKALQYSLRELKNPYKFDPYKFNDMYLFQGIPPIKPTPYSALLTLDELLERDKKRDDDGFPRKIKLGKIVKPAKGKKGKVVIVPVTTEDKFIHDDRLGLGGMGQGGGGSGEGEEGEVIGEQPIKGEGEGEGEGEEGGEGDGGDHGIESRAYELGRILTEKFELPNLQDKGRKRTVKRYTYDLTDKNRGHGQFLDKKSTLKKIIETNLNLGNVDKDNIDTTKFIIGPNDKIYRLLSREVEYESEAVVFFLRDYSGSMWGKPTEVVVTQHLFLYAWLLYQYEKRVTPRFIVHDTQAKEVPDFHTYYNLSIAGGTDIHTSFKLVNEIVEKENLAKDYNIYVFYGGDGEDWRDGAETLEEINKIITYTNRTGITVAEHPYDQQSRLERYIRNSNILEEKPDLIRMDTMKSDSATEERIIEGIIKLIS